MLLLVIPIAIAVWIAAGVLVLSLCAMSARASAAEPDEWAELEPDLMPRAREGVRSVEELLRPGGLVLGGPRRFG